MVARYIRVADFHRDTFPHRARPLQVVPDVYDGEPVATLLADSPYLRQAGHGGKEFYSLIKEDLKQYSHYSQHAAAFILTVLPNVKALTLSELWKPLDKTEKLLDLIVWKTKQSYLLWNRPSLAQVTRFESYFSSGAGHRFDLDKAVPFLALPQVRSFRGPRSVAIDNASNALASKDLYLHYVETLETAHLVGCCIDHVAITNFLKHTPRLKALKYSHSTNGDGDHHEWDICKFVTAIECEAGSHLEDLSVSLLQLRGSITPGKASMRGFRCLQKLEFPLEIAMCNVTDVASRVAKSNEGLTDQVLDKLESFIGDLVPASVSHYHFYHAEETTMRRPLGSCFVSSQLRRILSFLLSRKSVFPPL